MPHLQRNLGCFHNLAIVNNAAMNLGRKIYLQYPIFISLGYVSIVGLLEHMIALFPFLHILASTCYHLSA